MVSFTRRSAARLLSRGARPAIARARTAPLLPAAYDELAGWSASPLHDIVLLSRHAPVRVANELARRHPEATVHLLDHQGINPERLRSLSDAVRLHRVPDVDARMTALADLPAPQLIIDIGSDLRRQLAWFAQQFYFLQPGGSYVLHDRPGAGGETPPALPHPAPLVALGVVAEGKHRNLLAGELLASCARVDYPAAGVDGAVTVVAKGHEHLVSLRDRFADERLAARFGTAWGETLAERPPLEFPVTATIVEHGDRGEWHGQTEHDEIVDTMDVPRLYLRRYHDVVCWPEQLVAKDNIWLPDTFRHALHGRLQHRRLVSPTHWHARRNDTSPTTSRSIDAPVFYFDTEYPGHFGHVLTEVVSRWWGWREALRHEPALRPLTTRPFGSAGIPPFQREIFTALGIDPDEIEYVDKGEAVAVRELYAASPMLSMPFYVSPELSEAWTTVGAALRGDPAGRPRRIFIARRVKPIRSCLNTTQVEAFFLELGFELFYPEDHSFGEQVAAFAAADVIAGFAGSNMFTAMFAGPKKLIVLTSDSYNANNEFFIAAVTGSELHYVIGDAQHKHPKDRWTWLAYQANFTIDLDRFGPEIVAVIEG